MVFGLKLSDALRLIIILLLVWNLYRIIHSDSTAIFWADFISTRGADGVQHGDINKVGQWAGIFIAFMSVFMYADNEKVEPIGLSALLGVALLYLGGVATYAATLRSKRDVVTTVTEPINGSKDFTKTTVMHTIRPPTKDKP